MNRLRRHGTGRRIGAGVIVALALCAAALAGFASAAEARQGTPAPEVFAEAVGTANLREGPGIDYPVVGEIAAGTRYRVLARHTLVPWLRIDWPGRAGPSWVYADLVTVTGDLARVEQVSGFDAPAAASTTPLPVNQSPTAPAVAAPGTPTPTLTPTPLGPTVTTLGEANIRFGPDLSYPVVARVPQGATFRLLEIHSLVPWLRIELPESPTGDGWLYTDIVEITGDTSRVPRSTVQQVNYPTLTPTPQTVVVSSLPWAGQSPAGQLALSLGQQVHDTLLADGFVPYTDQFGSVFVMDLSTGDTFTVNDNIAFSGMSLTKIAVLAAYFKQQRGLMSANEAFLVADTMMCSENITTNALLELIGEGDALRGAQRVTAFLQGLDLRGTFLMRQFRLREGEPEVGVGTLTTGADQVSARPDRYNQMLPKELGFLLAGIYQCAQDGTGLLTERYPQDFDITKCRKMLYAMDTNEIGGFLEAGVPPDAIVIHKHGWVDDTHGDAGIVIAPDGRAYVAVIALYGRDWLEFEQSAPVIGEISRLVWNGLHPENPVGAVTESVVPLECDPTNHPVIQALMASSLPMIGPAVSASSAR